MHELQYWLMPAEGRQIFDGSSLRQLSWPVMLSRSQGR
jgi:hypothetical protein